MKRRLCSMILKRPAIAAFLTILATVLLTAAPTRAEDLTIAIGADVTSLDPQFHSGTPNNMVARHIFDGLVLQDENKRPVPGLAESWAALDDTTWEFHLRRGVVFHDGTPFTVADVVASLKRAAHVTGSPLSFAPNLGSVTDIQAVDDHTLRLRTARPEPLLPNSISNIMILPAHIAISADRAAFDDGRVVIGTGPFRFVGWQRGEIIQLEANDTYWGGRPQWDRVNIRIVLKNGVRAALLIANEVQVIDFVPPADVAQLRDSPDIALFKGLAARVFYLHFDHHRTRSPFVTDRAGRPLDRNPLRDVRVRRAMSKAINRNILVDQVMEGQAVVAGQLLPDGCFGVSPNIPLEAYDPEGARRLLVEAGYPDGFVLTLHTPNNRYVNDVLIARSIAMMLSPVGIVTRVEPLPSAEFFPRASNLEFSTFFASFGSDTAETGDLLISLLGTFDKLVNRGAANRGRYSNPDLDAVLDRAATAIDRKQREALLQKASEIAMADLGLIPLYFGVNVWAMRRGLTYTPRTDEYTLAIGVKRE